MGGFIKGIVTGIASFGLGFAVLSVLFPVGQGQDPDAAEQVAEGEETSQSLAPAPQVAPSPEENAAVSPAPDASPDASPDTSPGGAAINPEAVDEAVREALADLAPEGASEADATPDEGLGGGADPDPSSAEEVLTGLLNGPVDPTPAAGAEPSDVGEGAIAEGAPAQPGGAGPDAEPGTDMPEADSPDAGDVLVQAPGPAQLSEVVAAAGDGMGDPGVAVMADGAETAPTSDAPETDAPGEEPAPAAQAPIRAEAESDLAASPEAATAAPDTPESDATPAMAVTVEPDPAPSDPAANEGDPATTDPAPQPPAEPEAASEPAPDTGQPEPRAASAVGDVVDAEPSPVSVDAPAGDAAPAEVSPQPIADPVDPSPAEPESADPSPDAPALQQDAARPVTPPAAPAPETLPRVAPMPSGTPGVSVRRGGDEAGARLAPVEGVTLGRLPRIGGDPAPRPDPDGAPESETGFDLSLPAYLRYGAPIEAIGAARPLGVLLFEEASAEDALIGLSMPVTLAMDPFDPDAPRRAQAYRAAGHEIALLARNIPPGATPSDLAVTLDAFFRGFPETVALVDVTTDPIASSRVLARDLSLMLEPDGYGVIARRRGLDAFLGAAHDAGLAATGIYRVIDESGQSAVTMRRLIDRAAFEAGRSDGILIAGSAANPETLQVLSDWAQEGARDGVTMVPASSVLTAE